MDPYYGDDLALVHHLGFGFHADGCAPGILALLAPVLSRGGLVVEIGCGSGLLTAHLVSAGHRVVATDASESMLSIASSYVPGAEDFRLLRLPDDPIPKADAIVSVGHVLSYLPDAGALEKALIAIAGSLEPGGVMAIDLCDLEWGRARIGAPPSVRRTDDWVIITEFSQPSPEVFVRDITTFLRNTDATWRRSDERHENVLIDTSSVPDLLRGQGIDAKVCPSFGAEELMPGLVAIIGHRSA